MARNKKYKFTKKAGSFAREKFAPNPTKSLDAFGWVGKIIGSALNAVLSRFIHVATYKTTGTIYKKGRHPAWVGSVIYTLVFIGMMGLLSAGVSTVFR